LDEKNYLDHLTKLTPIGGIIDLETPPTAINVKLYPDFPCDDLSTTEYKIKKDMNGNMDQSQVMGKSLFKLTKNSKISQ
jgi:hypothetical protein